MKTPQDNTTGYRCPQGIWNLSAHMALKIFWYKVKKFLRLGKNEIFWAKIGQII